MSEDRLGEIKHRQGKVIYGDPGMLADLSWLISEVEKERALKDAITRLGNAVAEDAREKEATIATLQKPVKVYRESQKCHNCAAGAFCARHDDLFWGAMREALATPAQEDEDKPLFEGKWTGSMGPVQEDRENRDDA